jgi:cation diffusion facilitator CzcD-associated flavoprotein CzcO
MEDFARTSTSNPDFQIAIVGSGFAGLGMAVNLKRAGIEDFVILERAEELGGTWRDNTYPGCQCDVPSTLYSFSFAPNFNWTHTFPLQQEIWDYLRRVARENGIVDKLRFGHELTAGTWLPEGPHWELETPRGRLTARVLVLGTGALSEPSIPPLPGLESFTGTVFHSARWNHEHDLSGERVAVIGTGASAIQFVPRIRPQVERLHIYQRTPPWIMPHPDRPTTELERTVWRAIPRSQHLWRGAVWTARESLVVGLTLEPRLMSSMERVARRHLRRQVPDPALRRALTPRYRLGCKRILISNEYLPALCEDNVELVADGVREMRPRSIVAGDGSEREVDTIIFGTGFQVTSPPSAAYLRGRHGQLLADAWSDGMSAYLGTTISGFPNAFMIVGPNTGLGHSSMIYMIESQIAYVMQALRAMARRGALAIDVRADVQRAYNDELQRRLERTVWNTGGCRSWYLDSGGRNTTLWPSFTFRFRERTRSFDESDYELTAETGTAGSGGIYAHGGTTTTARAGAIH